MERVLNLSDLSTVYAFGVKIAGHSFYVLTLVDLNISLAYDLTTKTWGTWSSLTAGSAKSVTSITLSGTTATVVCTAHGFSDGDPINIAGATVAGYNGIFSITYVDANTFTYQTTAGLSAAAGTITATPYTETYFKYTKYINAFGKDLLMHESDGTLVEIVDTDYADVGAPINVLIRTGKFDASTMQRKHFGSTEIIGNKTSSTAYIRYSQDDYVTYTLYRPIDLNADRSIIRRCGSSRRRSWDIKHIDPTDLQIVELDFDEVITL